MLATLLRGASAAGRLEFVGGRAGAVANTATPSFSLTSLSGGLAAAPSAGDVVVACVAFVASDTNISCTTPGYIEVADLFASDEEGDINLGVYYKVLTAADTSVEFAVRDSSGTDSVICVHVWRKAAASPLDATSTTAVGSNGGVPNAPAITTQSPNAVVLAIGAAGGGGDARIRALTAPAGMGNFFAALYGDDVAIGIASAVVPIPATYDPASFGGGTTDADATRAAVTMALRPA